MAVTSSTSIPSRRILITGASSGIGFQAALRLCRNGHQLSLPCRDAATATATLTRIEQQRDRGDTNFPSIQAPVLDLADLNSVKSFADRLLAKGEPIDTLVLNAGLQYTGAAQSRRSAQNYELTIAVNHLGHQALTQQLLPLLEIGNNPRIVITASEVHDPNSPGGRFGEAAGLGALDGLKAGAGFEMVDGCSAFNADKAYKDSKLCNLLFARELAKQLARKGTPLPVVAWAPGLVIPRGDDGFFRYSRTFNPWGQRLFALAVRDLLRITESPEDAGELLAGLASDSESAANGFSYRSNRLLRPGQHRFDLADVSPEANNDGLATKLWELSADLIKRAS